MQWALRAVAAHGKYHQNFLHGAESADSIDGISASALSSSPLTKSMIVKLRLMRLGRLKLVSLRTRSVLQSCAFRHCCKKVQATEAQQVARNYQACGQSALIAHLQTIYVIRPRI